MNQEILNRNSKMNERKRGNLTVLEGLDGIGKGLVQKTLIKFEERGKIRCLPQDFYGFLKDYDLEFTENENLKKFNPGKLILEVSEPTHFGIGPVIREEIIAKNSRDYSSDIKIQAYSLDRLILMKRVIIPFLEHGQDVIQSRNFASTLCYQSLEAQAEGKSIEDVRKKILEQEGSQIELEYAPNLLIISTIQDVSELIERLERRKKTDECIFENINFQTQLKPFYEDPWLKDLFVKHGTTVAYLDAGISEESTKEQAIEIYSDFYDKDIVQEQYKSP